jgi:hypothetical protein
MMSIQTCSKGLAEESYKVIEKNFGVGEMGETGLLPFNLPDFSAVV